MIIVTSWLAAANYTLALWLYNHRPFRRYAHTTWMRFLWQNGVRPY